MPGVVWVLMLACLGLFFRRKIEVRSLLMLAAASVAGCVLVALPLFITNTRPRDTYSTAYRLMISPEGLEHQRLHASVTLNDEQLSTFDGYLLILRRRSYYPTVARRSKANVPPARWSFQCTTRVSVSRYSGSAFA